MHSILFVAYGEEFLKKKINAKGKGKVVPVL
jgi:hypothetical protein